MKRDKKESIEDLLLHIRHQPDVKEALEESYRFFKTLFPLDLLALLVFTPKEQVIHYKALISEQEVILIDESVPLSTDGQKQAMKVSQEKIILLAAHQTAAARDFAFYLDMTFEKVCSLVLTTEIAPRRFGGVGLVSMGEDKFHQKHIDLLRTYYNPLSSMIHQLLSQVEMAGLKEKLVFENQLLRKKLGFLSGVQIIGSESSLKEVMNQIERVAPVDSHVLITGETGVGKEIVANAIHRRSRRAEKPFISINCGAIPETLLDSELFGYEKGAFTGAMGTKRGYFEQADEGTIFLDEIGELSLQAQVKLLRVLQGMPFQRVGGSRTISINVRVIAATNRDLQAAIKEEKFRRDLWFRLSVFPIQIPPLRERKEDIPALAEYFARNKSAEMNLPFKPVFAREAMEQLQSYDWPGNVRELQNVLERALILNQGSPLSFPNLDMVINGSKDEGSYEEGGQILTLDELVDRHIQKCLKITRGQVAGPNGAAELLGVHPSTLRGKMRKLGIRVTGSPAEPEA